MRAASVMVPVKFPHIEHGSLREKLHLSLPLYQRFYYPVSEELGCDWGINLIALLQVFVLPGSWQGRPTSSRCHPSTSRLLSLVVYYTISEKGLPQNRIVASSRRSRRGA